MKPGIFRGPKAHPPVNRRRERPLDGPSVCIGTKYTGLLASEPYVLVPGNGGHRPKPRTDDQPAHTVTAFVRHYLDPVEGRGRVARRERSAVVQADAPAFTIRARQHGAPPGAVGTDIERRPLTPIEAAILCGLPQEYPLYGSKTAQYRQIGNCVSPVMAEQLGRALLDAEQAMQVPERRAA